MNRLQDFRHGLRALFRAPGSALTAVACLAIGVAASTSVFSLANGLFLRPLPGIDAPERVVTIEGVGSYPNVRDLQRSQAPAGPFEGLAALVDQQVSFLPPAAGRGGDRGEAAAVLGQLVSGSYFEVLGTRPEVGRLLRPEDESEERSVVVLGHALWRERLGADPDVVGRTVRLNGEPFTVVGVAPEGFIGTFVGIRFDAWVPLPAARSLAPGFDLEDRAVDRVETVARLRPGTTPEQAGAALAVAARSLATAHPRANQDLELSVEPLTGFDPEVRGPALGLVAVLATVAFLVHLTACLNVTGLLLARASARRREMGVRVALGAGRTRVMAGVLAESLLVSVAGGAAGLLVAVRATESLHRLEPPVPFALAFDFSPDVRVLGFAFLAALLSGLVAGLPPALQASSASPMPALARGARSGGRRPRLQTLLVVGQVAASMVLLVVAGLFLRTLDHVAGADPGFDPEGVEIVPFLDLRLAGSTGPGAGSFFEEVRGAVEAIPGVEAAGLSARAPLTLRPGTAELRIAGHEPPAGQTGFEVGVDVATPGLFRALGIPLLAGRGFTPADRADAPAVAVVNRALAERFWPGQDALGRSLELEGRSLRVVGVVGDVQYRRLGDAPGPFLYTAHAQQAPAASDRMNLFVRRRPASPPVAPGVRRVLREHAPSLPVPEVVPVRRFLGIAFLPQRVAGTVSGILGAVVIGLAGMGLYSLMAFLVSRRVREIGVRLALGSIAGGVLRLVLGQALRLGAAGVAAGGVLSLVAAQGVSSLLFGVAPVDPATYLGVAALLLGTAALGSWAPALRASRVDPMEVLRQE